MNTRFIDGCFSSVGREIQQAPNINKRKAREFESREYRTKALITSVATGFMGFSTGFALQVLTRKYVPVFVSKNYIIPMLLSSYVSSRTYLHLLENEQENRHLYRRFTEKRDEPPADVTSLS